MTKLKLLALLFSFSFSAHAQDVIIKNNGDEIKSKIIDVELTAVKYKRFDNLTGPIFEILKSDIFIIKYENGTKDVGV